jgi:hypothetical protein
MRVKMGLWLALAMAAAGVAPVSCGSGTGGRVVSMEWAVRGVAEEGLAPGEMITDLGWHVRLAEAWLSLGPMRAHAASEDVLVGWDAPWPWPRRARAHPGHGQGFDRVRAEWLDQTAVDVLDPEPRSLGWVQAEAGAVDRVEGSLDPFAAPDGPSALQGGTVWVRGEAEREGQVVPFEGLLLIPDEGSARLVENMAAEVVLEEGGRLIVGVRPGLWFEGAQFDRLEAGDEGEPATIGTDGQVRNALYLGCRNPRAFVVTWAPVSDGGVE